MFDEISRKSEKIIKVSAIFSFKGSDSKEIEVTFYEPKDEAEIQQGLKNRLISEQRTINELAGVDILETKDILKQLEIE